MPVRAVAKAIADRHCHPERRFRCHRLGVCRTRALRRKICRSTAGSWRLQLIGKIFGEMSTDNISDQ